MLRFEDLTLGRDYALPDGLDLSSADKEQSEGKCPHSTDEATTINSPKRVGANYDDLESTSDHDMSGETSEGKSTWQLLSTNLFWL